MRVRFLLGVFLLAASAAGQPATAKPAAAKSAPTPAQYFESIRDNPLLLNAFLRAMPKGADLHNHLSGAVYAESYIAYAVHDNLSVDRATLTIVAAPCDAIAPPQATCANAARPPARCALSDA